MNIQCFCKVPHVSKKSRLFRPWWNEPSSGWCCAPPLGSPCGGSWCAAWSTASRTGVPDENCQGIVGPVASGQTSLLARILNSRQNNTAKKKQEVNSEPCYERALLAAFVFWRVKWVLGIKTKRGPTTMARFCLQSWVDPCSWTWCVKTMDVMRFKIPSCGCLLASTGPWI